MINGLHLFGGLLNGSNLIFRGFGSRAQAQSIAERSLRLWVLATRGGRLWTGYVPLLARHILVVNPNTRSYCCQTYFSRGLSTVSRSLLPGLRQWSRKNSAGQVTIQITTDTTSCHAHSRVECPLDNEPLLPDAPLL